MPGATRMGFLAYNPIIILLKAETNIVAVNTPLKGIPVSLRIDGFTMMIYIEAKKVVIPAITSVLVFDVSLLREFVIWKSPILKY